ncbi:DUF167 domain-containing protein [Asticcacaulis sp. AC460]|uniref:DUF167 domain-containing protein n=1 Tax=Asticcacaulis sp. AC460 TaxID=1282360 RepID=UPI0004CEA3E3|nr:DUF167 family protein [Asticcacaulis sp. AC460]
MRIAIRLTPRASADAVDGWGEDEQGRRFLKVRVRAAPIEGRANEALIAFLAKTLGIPKSRLSLVAGDTSRLKQIEIDGDVDLSRLA